MAGIIFQYPRRDGTTGLELEAVRHDYARVAPSYGCNLVNAVLQALDEAAACAPRETNAAVKIQATFRMHRQAATFRNMRRKTCMVQRVFRGYTTRKRLEHERTTTQRLSYLQTVFDMFATRIQACFRGYYSRKTRFNYYAQQAYISTVMSRSLGVLGDAHRTRIEQDKLRAAESQRVLALSYARCTAQMHHTISTCSIPSVYLRPPVSSVRLAPNSKLQPTAGGGRDGTRGDAGEGVGNATAEDYELAQAAVLTAGEKLEDDIQQNSRAARHNRVGTPGAPGVSRGTSPRPAAATTAPQTRAQSTDEKRSPTTATASQSPRLPALGANSGKQKVYAKTSGARVNGEGKAKNRLSVPWEEASATAPQRPLIEKVHRHTQSPLHTTTSASAAVAASTTPSDPSNNNTYKAVSSFHRKFGIRRHDCVEHNLSCEAGVVQNGAVAVTFPGPLSTAKESAALQHSVDQKVIKSLHGNDVFKVPASRGKRA
ncbi:hypothetical protein ABB37_03811 [Leptomonas pyrrhocoris]|uniref:Uncharacterized protein n=1 Tax=Leptomonas pyrrhocoris TaxID=157538 RepID=A0A0N0VFN5_LEPPY|nr:hypothetical protein ABB37_03811 [Leptomonas pyrrhocoris]KPA81444.1 hypothetical protein ABB37_03811 [Leptomonas pyrrhocoris]|eukprot:XP_015659883.1 hypothetical protein ABB37_03811 [Leptomonas pyrrhocoris]